MEYFAGLDAGVKATALPLTGPNRHPVRADRTIAEFAATTAASNGASAGSAGSAMACSGDRCLAALARSGPVRRRAVKGRPDGRPPPARQRPARRIRLNGAVSSPSFRGRRSRAPRPG